VAAIASFVRWGSKKVVSALITEANPSPESCRAASLLQRRGRVGKTARRDIFLLHNSAQHFVCTQPTRNAVQSGGGRAKESGTVIKHKTDHRSSF